MHYTVKFKNYLFKEQGFPDNSAGQESACNARDSGSIPGSRRSAGDGIGNTLQVFLGFPCGSAGKKSTCNAGDLGSILGLGRSPGEDYPLQYSGLENSTGCPSSQILFNIIEI